MRRTVADLLVVADDLTGAAESAAALVASNGGRAVPVHLLPEAGGAVEADFSRPVVIDTNTRGMPPGALSAALAPALALARPVVVKKIDSLLRGHVAAEIALLQPGGRTILAPSLPSAGRVVRDGRLRVDGAPLAETPAWRFEARAAPDSLLKSFSVRGDELSPGRDERSPTDGDTEGSSGAHGGALLTLDVVRGGEDALTAAIEAARGLVVCDAETDDDLLRIAAAALRMPGAPPLLVGSSALVAAVARRLAPAPPGDDAAGLRRSRTVFVVGTAEPSAQRQLSELEAQGCAVLRLDAAELLDGPTPAQRRLVEETLASPLSAITIDPRTGLDARHGAALSSALADALTPAPAPHEAVFVLTGGQTARAVLDRWGVRALAVHRTIDADAAWSLTDTGIPVVTRPGSFGGDGGFARILQGLAPDEHRRKAMEMTTTPERAVPADDLPVIATTMGDAAGVGPEITVAALLSPVVQERSRPVAIGDARRLEQAAALLGLTAEIVPIARVGDAVFTPGRVNVIDLGLIPEDLPWGELSPIAGDAAFQYVRVASELAMAGEVDAICTSPLNKEALHAAGHMYPGHTEMLASLTGTAEVSMLLSTPKIKVIHVTTHIGLIDAIAKIEPGLVERTIRRGITAMQGAGVTAPRVGVCAINPHAGENGLFGYGEEEEKIAPAIRVLQAEGLDVHGPLPADTAFFLGGRGDYDLIVAMYHDQGHGPVKVLGIEAGTNITAGLPVIRTSVDHGTAFDIAGTGTVDVRSMIEALRQAAEMSHARTRAS